MASQIKTLLLHLVILLTSGAALSSTASAARLEAPFWKVGGGRLGEAATKEVSLINKPEAVAIIHATLKGISVELRCKTLKATSALIVGSKSKSDGTGSGVITLSECKLFVEVKEDIKCKVSNIETVSLKGRLWYEGTEVEQGTKPAMVFEPNSGAKLAEVVIEGSECTFSGNFTLEGSFGARISPENEEATELTLILPKTAIKKV
jgi:hypothetical protein